MRVNLKVKSTIFFFLAAMIWGFAFVAQCDAADKISMFLFNGCRFMLGAISLFPIIFLHENKAEKQSDNKPEIKKTILCGILCGTILFVASTLQQWGINISPNAGKAGFITGIYTVLVPIIYFLLFRRKTGWNVWLGAICSAIGLYFLSVTNGFGSIETSDKILFLGSIFWAFHIITIDKFINNISPLKFSAIQFFTCSVLSLISAAVSGELTLSIASAQISAALIPILYAGIFSSGVGYTLQALGQRGADPTYSAIILSCESVFAAIGGAIFGTDAKMTARALIGCIIIFAGIVFSQVSPTQIFKKRIK